MALPTIDAEGDDMADPSPYPEGSNDAGGARIPRWLQLAGIVVVIVVLLVVVVMLVGSGHTSPIVH
jgi:hypothetical protein